VKTAWTSPLSPPSAATQNVLLVWYGRTPSKDEADDGTLGNYPLASTISISLVVNHLA